MRPDSWRIHGADWLHALHPVTPTETQMESLRVAGAIDRAKVVKM